MPHSPLLAQRPFILTDGGPTYLIQKRLGLTREDSPLAVRRAVVSVVLTWVSLLILAALQHHAVGREVPLPFLKDIAVHARFLLALPLLILAETVIGPHLAHAAAHFVSSGVVIKADYPRFNDAVERGLKWRDSILAEGIILALSFGVAVTNLSSFALHLTTWASIRDGDTTTFTWAGWWFVLFCVPVFQFFSLRWMWRIFLWGQFLWRMNQLDLKLIPTHPDQAGGLGFLGEAQRFFALILFAYSVAVAGVLANSVIYDKIALKHFAPSIAGYVLLLVFMALLPLSLFAGRLLKTRRQGLYQYGSFATEYTSSFHQKWILGGASQDQDLLGTSDIQSLADLGNSFGFIEKMNAMPMSPRTPIHLAFACLLPMFPLLLTVMPLGDLIKLLVKVAA